MNNSILDSGNRTKYSTGAVRDIQESKGRCDLLPLAVIANFIERTIGYDESQIIRQIATFMEIGDSKYLYIALNLFCQHKNWNVTECLLEVSIHYKQGAEKYGERNWEKGIPLHSYIDSAVRHFLKNIDGQVDERHDRAFVWNILGALWTMMYKHGTELIDIPFELLSGIQNDDSIPSQPWTERIMKEFERVM